MIIVSNSTPLIGLASIGRFELLQQLFGEIYTPQAVFDEVVVAGRSRSGVAELSTAIGVWINVVSIQDRLAVDVLLDEIDLGEAETIVLARELNADLVLMDERKGRRKLSQLRLSKMGAVGVLLKAKQAGFVPVIRDDLTLLREKGFSISQTVIDVILEEAGEK